MARKQLKLAFIENASKRRETYIKRVKGLMKATKELSVLSGLPACVVVYDPYGTKPVTWPNAVDTKKVLRKYTSLPSMDQSERRFSQARFLDELVAKAEEELAMIKRKNREMEMENLLMDLISGKKKIHEVALCDAKDLLWVIDENLRDVQCLVSDLPGMPNNVLN